MTESKPAAIAPPPVSSKRAWPLPLLLGVGFLVVVVLGVLFLFDPIRHAFYPVCLFKSMTGYDCPGCGGLRAAHQLLRGEVWQAFQLNPMVMVVLPLAGGWAIRSWLSSRKAGDRRKPLALGWVWLLIAVILVFGIVRNLPFWPFDVTPG